MFVFSTVVWNETFYTDVSTVTNSSVNMLKSVQDKIHNKLATLMSTPLRQNYSSRIGKHYRTESKCDKPLSSSSVHGLRHKWSNEQTSKVDEFANERADVMGFYVWVCLCIFVVYERKQKTVLHDVFIYEYKIIRSEQLNGVIEIYFTLILILVAWLSRRR